MLDLKKHYNQNEVLAKVLFEHIKNSHEWNWMFELDIDSNKKDFIDKSKWMILWLHTDWGWWKTTLIESLKNYLDNEDKDKYFVEIINAWQFNKEKKEDLWMSIISYFYIKIVEKYKDELKNDKDLKSLIWKLTLSNLASITNKLTWIVMPEVSFLTKWLVDFSTEIEGNDPTKWLDWIKNNISLFYSMQEDIIKILENEKNASKVKKYVLVIDDLDRCSPKEVVNLLDALKLFLNIPNLIVIVAVDRRHIEKWIYEVYNKWNDSKFIVNPDEYLEKIIHLPIDLFLFDEDIRKNLNFIKIKNDEKIFDDKFSENIINILKDKEIQKIIDFWLSSNPRKNLRFKRLFKFYYGLFDSKYISLFDETKDINQKFFTFWLILKMEWWNYFQEFTKTPILLYLPYQLNYSDESKVKEMLNSYSKVFYWKKTFEELDNYELGKIKKIIIFINNFADQIWVEYMNVVKYFYSYQLWKSFYDAWKWDMLLIKPIVDLELFESVWDFKDRYKNLIKEFTIDNENLNNTLSSLDLTNFENSILERIFPSYKKDKEYNENNNQSVGKNTKETNSSFNLNIEDLLKSFEITEKQKFQNNKDIFDNAYHDHVKMIVGIDKLQKVKEIDPKRFILWSKLFFDLITNNANFDKLSEIKINIDTSLNETEQFIKILDKEQIDFNLLWEEHILKNLSNNERRTLFWELINQISFAKDGPSIWWMTWATDYTQLESLVIDAIKDKVKLKEWALILKTTVIVSKNIKSIDEQLEKYSNMIYFLQNNISESDFENRLKRLEKRLIYIFSHFWSLQNIDLFVPYYSTTKEGLRLLWKWYDKYWKLKESIDNYKNLCIAFNKYLDEYIKTILNNFDNEFDEYFNDNFTDDLETIFLWNKIKIDNEYVKKFIKVKIIEHKLIRFIEFKNKRILLTEKIYIDFNDEFYKLYKNDFDNNNFYIKKINNETNSWLELVTSIISRWIDVKELLSSKDYKFYWSLSRKKDDLFEIDFALNDFTIGYMK